MARYHGKKGRVYASTTGSGTASPVAQLSNWSIDQATDTVEVSAFGDGNKQYVQGLRDARGALSGFWDDSQDVLWDASESADAVKMYLYPSTDAATIYWYGYAWLSMSIEVPISGPVQVNGTWVAGSDWTRKP